MNRTILSVVVLLAAITGVLCDTCGSNTCLGGQVCCEDVVRGATCYDADGYSCPLGSAGNILCGFQEHGPDFACATTCYDNVDYVCCNDTVYNRNAADIPWDMCINNGGSDSPSTASPSTAAPSTASPSTASPSTSAPVFMCGNSACASGFCCNDVRLGAVCYDPSTHSCPLGSQGNLLCNFEANSEDFACGLTCYNNMTHICCNDNVVYNRNQTAVPCLNNTSVDGGGETSGSIIITTNLTSSSEETGDNFGVACGNVHCATSEACCATMEAGPVCYSTSSNSCVKNGDLGNVLCGAAQQLCNTTCFNPASFYCSFDGTIVFSGSSSQFAGMNYVFGLVFVLMVSRLF